MCLKIQAYCHFTSVLPIPAQHFLLLFLQGITKTSSHQYLSYFLPTHPPPVVVFFHLWEYFQFTFWTQINSQLNKQEEKQGAHSACCTEAQAASRLCRSQCSARIPAILLLLLAPTLLQQTQMMLPDPARRHCPRSTASFKDILSLYYLTLGCRHSIPCETSHVELQGW